VVLGTAASSIRVVEATVPLRRFEPEHIGEIQGVVMTVTVASSGRSAGTRDRCGAPYPGNAPVEYHSLT
jgi:hypothetical protein